MKASQFSACLLLVTFSACYNVSDLSNDLSNDLSSELSSDYDEIMGSEDNMTELAGDIINDTEMEEEDLAPIDTGRRKGKDLGLSLDCIKNKSQTKS